MARLPRFVLPGHSQHVIQRGNNRVWSHAADGGFIITFDAPSSLDDCKHKYAYFLSDPIQPEKLKNSFASALAAFHSGSTVGVVIDKGQSDDYCYVSSMDLRK